MKYLICIVYDRIFIYAVKRKLQSDNHHFLLYNMYSRYASGKLRIIF